MRPGLVLALLAAAVAAAAAQPTGPVARWTVTTDSHHAECLRQALVDVPVTIAADGDVATVAIDVAPHDCAYAIDRLQAYGFDEVLIEGAPRRLLDLMGGCGRRMLDDRRWYGTRAYLDGELTLWDTFAAGVRADEHGSIDAAAARDLAAGCRPMVAAVANPPGAGLTTLGHIRRRRFTHDAWTGTLDDVADHWCPRLEVAARRIRDRATTARRLRPTRRDLFLTSPEGWYLPGGARPTLSAAVLVPARVWIQVEDATLVDIIHNVCPFDTPVVTRYTRFTFAGDTIIARKATTTCAPFSRAHLR